MPEEAAVEQVACGGFWGYSIEYVEESRYWRMWGLARGRTELFVTFNCPEERRHIHRDMVEWMLSSLEGEIP